MLMFTLAISCLTMFNLPWFMDLTFQVLVQYCFLHHFTFTPDRSITEHSFCFGPAASFFLDMKITQSCLILCNPMGYTVHGILQARILEWVAVPFSRGSSQPRDQTQVSHIAGRFFTSWATRESREISVMQPKKAQECHPPPEDKRDKKEFSEPPEGVRHCQHL